MVHQASSSSFRSERPKLRFVRVRQGTAQSQSQKCVLAASVEYVTATVCQCAAAARGTRTGILPVVTCTVTEVRTTQRFRVTAADGQGPTARARQGSDLDRLDNSGDDHDPSHTSLSWQTVSR